MVGAALAACTEFSASVADAGPEPSVATDAASADVVAGDAAAPDAAVSEASDAANAYCDEPDLLGRWRMNEGSGTRVLDCTSGGRHGDLIGGAWIEGPNGAKALAFVGGNSSSRVDLGNGQALRIEGAMSLSAWVNVKTVASFGRIVAKSALEGDRGWDLYLDTDGALELRIATGPSSYVAVRRVIFPRNQWKHVAAVYEPGSALRLYIDGSLAASNMTGIPGLQRNSTQPVYIAARSDCCTLDGALYDVRIYKRALTGPDVTRLFSTK